MPNECDCAACGHPTYVSVYAVHQGWYDDIVEIKKRNLCEYHYRQCESVAFTSIEEAQAEAIARTLIMTEP